MELHWVISIDQFYDDFFYDIIWSTFSFQFEKFISYVVCKGSVDGIKRMVVVQCPLQFYHTSIYINFKYWPSQLDPLLIYSFNHISTCLSSVHLSTIFICRLKTWLPGILSSNVVQYLFSISILIVWIYFWRVHVVCKGCLNKVVLLQKYRLRGNLL